VFIECEEKYDEGSYPKIADIVKRNLNHITQYELKNLIEPDSIFAVVNKHFWHRRNVGLWPCILLYHSYSIPQTKVILWTQQIGDVLNFEMFSNKRNKVDLVHILLKLVQMSINVPRMV